MLHQHIHNLTESGEQTIDFGAVKAQVSVMAKCRPVDGNLNIKIEFLKGEDVLKTLDINTPRPNRDFFVLDNQTMVVRYTITSGIIQFIRLM